MGNIFVILIVVGVLIFRTVTSQPKKKENTQKQPVTPPVPTNEPQPRTVHKKAKKNEMFLNEEAKINTKTQWAETKPIEPEPAPENTPKIDLTDTDELKRAVLYSEILHRKYE